ncbi:hypothetical protein OC845_000543 [Tilletia horrida]|nr:hypothetical protein OC845_000543 [Tilletia horrida]
MQFRSSILAVVAFATTSALASTSLQLVERDVDPSIKCIPFAGYGGYGGYGYGYDGGASDPSMPTALPGIALPKFNQTITPGVPFLFQYCSGQYFKTHTIEISVGFDDGSGKGVVNLLKYNVGPSDQYTYKFNLTTTRAEAGKGLLVVSEIASGYYEPYQYITKSVQTRVKPAKFLGIL